MYTISKNKVRLHMKKHGISTQKQLAEQLGISKNQLSMLLSPNFNPIKSNALKLCEILNVNFEEIIDSEQMELSLDGTDNLIDSNIDEEINVSSFEGNEFLDIRDIKANKDYSVVELFAGAGGLALGLEQAGFKSRGLVEFDKYACQTLRKNRPHWNVIEKDIIDVAEEGIKNFVNVPIGELDLLSVGYPCQAYSYAGKKMVLSDTRC
ncbi:DNA (cytosine-5-)-methyltransferase, partial [Bacillus glycinifermentans]|uniref:DNA (cytosine-5-)-methyltransferase n=1 Tax=Bacillus glycinifermentans TaxID=1664069 RepID=UPI002DC01A23